jgi:hypothetical protein
MGHGLRQGIDVLAKTKAPRLDGSICEIDKRKPSFGHARKYSAGGKILRVAVRAVGCPLTSAFEHPQRRRSRRDEWHVDQLEWHSHPIIQDNDRQCAD